MHDKDALTTDLVERLTRFRQRLLDQGRSTEAARVDLAIAEARSSVGISSPAGTLSPIH